MVKIFAKLYYQISKYVFCCGQNSRMDFVEYIFYPFNMCPPLFLLLNLSQYNKGYCIFHHVMSIRFSL